MDILTFMGEHPWQTFFLLPFASLALFVCMLFLEYCIKIVFLTINRMLRTIKVCVRGWPPDHLDADGDWKPKDD